MNNTELAYQIEMLTQTVGRLCEAAHLDGMLEFPIVKDTTPNITNSRLNNIP